MLHRFWFTFKGLSLSPLALGCGVTAYDYEDAVSIIKSKIFMEDNMPEINSVIENIDIESLDKGHVIPNIGMVIARGIWFPLGY